MVLMVATFILQNNSNNKKPQMWFSKEYIKLDRDKSTFKSHRDFSSEKEISFKHF